MLALGTLCYAIMCIIKVDVTLFPFPTTRQLLSLHSLPLKLQTRHWGLHYFAREKKMTQATEIYCLMDLETRSLTARCWEVGFLVKTMKENLSHALS